MARETQPDNTAKVVLIVVGSILGVACLIALVCGGFFFLTTYVFVKTAGRMQDMAAGEMDRMEAVTAAQRFAAELGANQLPQAYDSTSRNYQAHNKLDDLRAYLDQHPILKQPGSFTQLQGAPEINGHIVVRLIYNNNQTTSASFNMVKEDGRWKVDLFTQP